MVEPKVFGVVALKGGVGKTTVVANLGAALAQEFQKKVLLVDANFSTPHLGLHLGMVRPEYTLHHVLNDNFSVYEAVYRHPLGFHIIPGAISPVPVNPWALKNKLDPLRDLYDVILIDSSPSLNEEMVATMAASDQILVVSSPDYPTLSSTLYAIKVAQEKNTPVRGIIINKIRNKRFELSPRDIARASEVDVLATLQDDTKVLESLSQMTPVVSHSPRHKVSKEYKRLAGSLIGEARDSKIKKTLKKLIKKRKRR